MGIGADTVLYHYAKHMDTLDRTVASSGIALVPGIIKEIEDGTSSDSHFGWDDLVADILGAVAGSFTSELVNGQFWISASGSQLRLVGKW